MECNGQPFLECSLCGAIWRDYREVVTDPQLSVVGYQPCFDNPYDGLILVTHEVEGCGTTLAVRAHKLRLLYDGPVWPELKKGTAECCLLCINEGDLEDCTAECAMAWVRTVLQYLRRHELPPHLAAGALVQE